MTELPGRSAKSKHSYIIHRYGPQKSNLVYWCDQVRNGPRIAVPKRVKTPLVCREGIPFLRGGCCPAFLRNLSSAAPYLTLTLYGLHREKLSGKEGHPLLPAQSTLASVYMTKKLTPLPEPRADNGARHDLIVSP